jgi:predicted PurR-regulated permease PerM
MTDPAPTPTDPRPSQAAELAATRAREAAQSVRRAVPSRREGQMSAAGSSSSRAGGGTGRRNIEISISIRTIVLIAGAVAIAWAVASIANVLLLIFVSVFNVAVLSPVVTAMERRWGWSRGRCAAVLVLGVVIVIAAVMLVLTQAIAGAVRGFSHDLPQIVGTVRHSDLGAFINGGSGSLDTLRQHASDITRGVGKVSGGVAHIGVSAFGAVTLVFSVIFLAFRARRRTARAGLDRGAAVSRHAGPLRPGHGSDRPDDLAPHARQPGHLSDLRDRLRHHGSDPRPSVPARHRRDRGILDLVPTIGATIAGVITGIVALSVSVEALIAFVIVIVLYQQIENYILQPTIIGKAAAVSGFTVLVSVLAFGALFGIIGAIIGVPVAAALQIVVEELSAGRRARIAAADAAEQHQPA